MLELRSQTVKGQRVRAAILAAAEHRFVTAGFHGASVRELAAAAGLPLATVVYHFARKEQLYAAVLAAIAEELMHELAALPAGDPMVRVEGLARVLVRWAARRPGRVRLLLRELLDNPARLARASQFPLAPFLEGAAAVVAEAELAAGPPELVVLHLVGAVSYVVAAWPTVERIVGRARGKQLAAASEAEAMAFARRVLGLAKETTREPRSTAPARPPRARARRAADHGHRGGPDDAAGGGLPRRGKARARARPAVPRLPARGRPRVAARRAG